MHHYLVSHGNTSSQNSLLVHDVCRGVSEPQLFCVAVSAVLLLKFVLTIQTRPFAAQIEPTVFFFRVASNLAPILSRVSSTLEFCIYFFCLDLILLLQTFPRFLKLSSSLHVVVRKLPSEFMTFILGSVFSVYTAEAYDVTIPTEKEE